MVFKPIEDNIFKFEKTGDSIEGMYLTHREQLGKFKSNLYTLKTAEGKLVSFWGGTVLDDEMAKVSYGDVIRIVFRGKNKEKDYNDFQVLIDDGNNE